MSKKNDEDNIVACSHCHLEFSKNVMIKDGENFFCCKGCQGVYHLLQDEGLESFYAKAKDVKLTPPTKQYEDATNFDTPAFYERFVKNDSDGFSEVSLVIEGIHCSACVWLNEKALHKMDGVIDVNINYTNNKAKVTFDSEVVKLSQIIEMIRAIGYNAFPYDASIAESRANKERKDYYLRMAVAIFSAMNIMWIAIAQYSGYFTGIRQETKTILNIAEWVLSTPVLFYSGWIFFRGAYYGLKTKTVNMDILVATGATLTYIFSIIITLSESGEAYFDSVTMIITFVLIGKFLEVLSKKNVADTLDSINAHIPSEVTIISNKLPKTIPLKEVNVDDIILVKSGEKVAIDGVVLEGFSGNFDESSLTGESEPIFKSEGDEIISGTTSIDATLHYRATKDFEHSTLANIVSLLENALSKKPKIQQLANRLSEYFSTVILLLSFATFAFWYFSLSESFEASFIVGISVIIIACPCALALATPVATLVGMGLALKKGILFKQSAQLETMAKTSMLLLDKTGTITEGKPNVLNVIEFEGYNASLIKSITEQSKHPVSKSVHDYLQESRSLELQNVQSLAGLGLSASYNQKALFAGNRKLMHSIGIESDFESENTLFFVALEGKLIAIFELQDSIKENASKAIVNFKSAGVQVVMLTGDNAKSAQIIAQKVGIDEVHSELSPEGKAAFVTEKKNEGHTIVMVGDGVNDILALATADIGIAMGSGSDISVDVSDVVLMNSSLEALSEAFNISKTTFRLIKQNLALSLLYNAITIPLAMMGYIIPLIAAISMSVSSLLVVFNSLRIKVINK